MEGIDDVIVNGADDHYPNNSDKQLLWNVMIKHCILFGTALLANQSFYLTVILAFTIHDNSTFSSKVMSCCVVNAIENTINVMILWLALRMNNDKYVYLCKCWHS